MQFVWRGAVSGLELRFWRSAAILLYAAGMVSDARADTWQFTMSPTNLISEFQLQSPPFLYDEILWYHSGDYLVPTLDPAKFTITNVNFYISGSVAAAIGGYESYTADGSIETSVSVSQAEQQWFSDDRLASPEESPFILAFALFSDYKQQPLDLSYFGNACNTNFLTGSPRAENGFVPVTIVVRAETLERLFSPDYSEQYSATLFSAMTKFLLTVSYGYKTIGPAILPGDLPANDPLPPFAITTHQAVGTNYHRYPDTESWPPAFRNLLGLRITDTHKIGGGVQLTWNTLPGKTNFVQSATNPSGPFVDISGPIVSPGEEEVVSATFSDIGAGTNTLSHCYRVRIER